MSRRLLKDLVQYGWADLRASVEFWHRGEAMGALLGAVIALAITVIGLRGVRVEFNQNNGQFWQVAIGAYLFVLLSIVTPFRMWRDQRLAIDKLTYRLTPKLAFDRFDAGSPRFVHSTKMTDSRTGALMDNVLFVTACPSVSSEEPVKSCKAILVRVTRSVDDGATWEETLLFRRKAAPLGRRWIHQIDPG